MSPKVRSRRAAPLIVFGVLFLALAGVAGALGRAAAVWRNPDHDPRDGTLTGYDRKAMDLAAALTGMDRSSDRFHAYHADVVAFSGKYYTHRLATLLHTVPGAVLLLLAPLQFSARVRSRHLRLHRWSGRLILVCAAPLGLSGFFFGTMPFAGVTETVGAWGFGAWFLFAGGRAYLAIQRRDLVRHREWMIRMLAVAIGISTVRLIDLLLFSTSRLSTRAAFGLAIWIGWIVTVAAAEAWIWATRPATDGRNGREAASAPRAAPTG